MKEQRRAIIMGATSGIREEESDVIDDIQGLVVDESLYITDSHFYQAGSGFLLIIIRVFLCRSE